MNKYFKYSFILSLCFMTPAIASDMLAQEAAEVRAYAQANPNLTLVLGETTDLCLIKQKYDTSYVFLDGCHTVDMPGRRLKADFNSLSDLAFLAHHLGNTFSRILLEQSTFHLTSWTVEHLAHFRTMLQPNGVFQFQPYHRRDDPSFRGCVFEDYPEFIAQAKQKLRANLSYTDLKLPAPPELEPGNLRVLPQLSASDQTLVDAKVTLYQALSAFALTQEDLDFERYGVSDDEENDLLQQQFQAKRAQMRAARTERGMAAEESKTYKREDLEDTQKLARQFTFDVLNHQLAVELNQEVYYPYLINVLSKVFSTAEIVKEPYPQYPDQIATFAKAIK